MSKRLWLTAGFILSLSVPSASTAQAQRVTMEWQNAPLTAVIRAFARFSGRTIVVAPDVGSPDVTASFQDIEWRSALSLLLAGLGLVERVDASGVIHVERWTPSPRQP